MDVDTQSVIELHAWDGDYGLVSMNVDCIHAILYGKLSNAPIKVTYKCNPYASLVPDYPLMLTASGKTGRGKRIYKTEEMLTHLRCENYGLDYMLTKRECSLSHAYHHMITSVMRPLVEFAFWANERNYEELTRVWYARAMYLPFNYLYATRRRKRALRMAALMFPNDAADMNAIECHLMRQAGETLSIVASHIGDNEYFFGTFASSIDALLYAYLAPLIKVPLPSLEIANAVRAFPTLVEYVERIDRKYFGDVAKEVKYLRKEADDARKLSTEDEFHTSIATKVFTFAFVFVAMFGYAASNNIIDMYKVRQFFTG